MRGNSVLRSGRPGIIAVTIGSWCLPGSEPLPHASIRSSKRRGNKGQSGQFLKALDRRYGALIFPQRKYLGFDLNPLGEHILALATPAQKLPLAPLMASFKTARTRLERIRKIEILNVQRKLALGNGTPKQQEIWKDQLSCLHRRRQRIMVDFKRQTLMIYLYGL